MADIPSPLLQSAASAARKKFATPPVKIACLSCRASRTRCNGEHPCASCSSKDKDCIYKPSRRGGPRNRRKPRPLDDSHDLAQSLPEPVAELPLMQMPVTNYIDPGAGLKNLNDLLQNDSDLLFDSLFMDGNVVGGPSSILDRPEPMVRTYGSNSAILNAYYIWIHPYFPILPAPHQPLVPEEVIPLFRSRTRDVEEPSSPVALAISAILALIACPQDGHCLSEESILFRRKMAQFLAQAAFESIETASEKLESDVDPARALDDSDDELGRERFHPNVPLDIESVIALDLLSVYEYAQRGNLKKMRSRSSAALMTAMNLSLHLHTNEEDIFSEARRRAWWMTYICICQSSIVSNIKPTFEVFAPSFTAKVPTINGDPEAWPLFIKSQQAILAATQFVIELNSAMKKQADMTAVYRRMTELELLLEPLINNSETWPLNCPITQPADQFEVVVAQSLRCMAGIKLNSARIKVHRYCAFFDLPVFSGKHCDLKAAVEKEKELPPDDIQHWPSCCSAFGNGASQAGMSPTLSMGSPPNSDRGQSHQPALALIFPFSSHQSAKICFKSALNIAQAFESIPYPNPSAEFCEAPCYLGPGSSMIAPRTMPSFACCAMQCAYVLLMVYEKTWTIYPTWNDESGGALVNSLLGRLQQGLLSILATLENYGSAFEALGGMRDQVRDRVYSTMVIAS